MGYPKDYYEAWEEMTQKPAYSWGMAPIHHGVFENGWRSALARAVEIVESGGSADEIRALAIYAKES